MEINQFKMSTLNMKIKQLKPRTLVWDYKYKKKLRI
jgi:hypothetical protein